MLLLLTDWQRACGCVCVWSLKQYSAVMDPLSDLSLSVVTVHLGSLGLLGVKM